MDTLVITNKQAAINFNLNYPRQPGIGGMEPAFPEGIVDEMRQMEGWGGATTEMSTAFILDKYNTGVSLLKADASGNLKKLRTTEHTDNDGNKTYESNNCQ